MNRIMRTTFSGFMGLLIALTLFLVMQGMLNPSQQTTSQADTAINFSFLKERPEITPPVTPDRPVKPQQQEAVTPPTLPPIDTTGGGTKIERGIPTKYKADTFELYKSLPTTGLPGQVGDGTANGGLKVGIAPFYPRQALVAQTEGWVEVLIKINEQGRVAAVSVLNAEPRNVFNQAALQAVRKWSFYPKQVSGQAVPYQVVQKIEFTLDK